MPVSKVWIVGAAGGAAAGALVYAVLLRKRAQKKRPAPKVWRSVSSVLEGAAEEIRVWTKKELEDEETFAKVWKAMSRGEEVQCNAKGLIVLGPSAAGKSYALREGQVHQPEKAVTLDGGFIRDSSHTWQYVAKMARKKGIAGFEDYFKGYFKEPMDALKHRITQKVFSEKANLIIPDTASNVKELKKTVDTLLDKGYNLEFVAVYADKQTCEERGKARESEEGKKFSSSNWEKSVNAIVDMQNHLMAKQLPTKIRVFENIGEVSERSVFDLERALTCGSKTIETTFLELRNLCGYYKVGDVDIELRLGSVNDNEGIAEVQLHPRPSECPDDYVLVFSAAQPVLVGGRCAAFDITNEDCMSKLQKIGSFDHFKLQIDWGEKFWCPQRVWTRSRETIAGLAVGLSTLKFDDGYTCDFTKESFRKLTEAEMNGAFADARVTGSNKAPRRAEPRALFVIAPSGGGKTTCMLKFASSFGIDPKEAVLADSAIFRDWHAPYAAVLANGKANLGLWYRAWPAVKKTMASDKKVIIDRAAEEHQDLIISDTGSSCDKLMEFISELVAKDYKVHILAVVANPQEIIKRGVAREIGEGKRYNRDVGKLCQTFDSIGPAQSVANGTYKVVLNSSGQEPKLLMEGVCFGGALHVKIAPYIQ